MGMDLSVYRAKNHEVFKHEGWWKSEEVTEEYYARKFWNLVEHCSFIPKDYESGEFIELTEENVEEMIQVACKYKNYFDNYDDIPKLCEMRDRMEELQEEGYKFYLEYDW